MIEKMGLLVVCAMLATTNPAGTAEQNVPTMLLPMFRRILRKRTIARMRMLWRQFSLRAESE
jgi:hypothetical protein